MAVPLTTAMQTQIANLYISILGRNPDPVGFGYWCDVYANANGTQAALDAIASGFGKSPEFTGIYSGQTTANAVALMYNNILGRTQDTAGATYWTGVANAYITSGKTVGDAYALTANAMITAAAANTGTADATLIASKQTTAVAAGTALPTTTYTMTTNIETIDASAPGNRVVNGVLGTTFQSFDGINGNGTNTTFNLTDNTTANFAMPTSTSLNGLTAVNVSRLATGGGTGAVTLTNTTFGTGVKTLTYTDSSLAASMTAAAFSATLNSATTVNAISNSTGVFTTVAITDTSTTAASTGSTLTTIGITGSSGAATLTGNGITTLNLNAAVTGSTATITAAAGTRALTINASGTTNQGAVTDANATSVTVNVSGAQTLGLVTVAKATTATINTTAAATTSISATVATTLNLGGSKSNALTVTAPALTSVVVTGAGGVTVDLSAITTLTSIDTSGSTAVLATATNGLTNTTNNVLTIGTGAAVTGGAGNDFITVGATTKAISLGGGTNQVTLNTGTTALGTGGSINGGTGTADVLVLANADAVTLSTAGSVQTAFKAAVTGFEVLDIGTAASSTISVSGFGSFTQLNVTTAAQTQVLSGVTSGFTLNTTLGLAALTSLTTNNLAGTADVINVNLNGDLSAAAQAFGTFTLPGTEILNLKLVDTNATFTTRLATVTIVDAGLQSLVVTGNNGAAITNTSVALTNFDASGLTKGSVTFTSGNLVGSASVKGSVSGGDTLNFAGSIANTTIVATAGTNTILGSSSVANTITGGTGADTITGGTGADVINGGNGNNNIYADNQGTKEVQTVAFSGTTTTAANANSITIDNITVNFTGGSSATVTGDNAVAAIQANSALSKIVSVSNNAGTVTATWLVDGNQNAVSAAFTTTNNAATVTETTTGAAGTAAADTITVGTGADFIAGGGGNDVITGGAGADTFFFMKPQSIVSGGATAKIQDFVTTSTASGDRIILGDQTAVASAAVATVQDYSSQASFTAAVNSAALANATNNGTVVFIWGGNTFVYVETTGAGATAANSDFIVQLTGTPAAAGTAVAGNFILGV